MPRSEDGDRYAYFREDIQDAVDEFNALSPHERHEYYDDFFEYWDFDEDEASLFWDLYRE